MDEIPDNVDLKDVEIWYQGETPGGRTARFY